MNNLLGFKNLSLYPVRHVALKKSFNIFRCYEDTYDRFNKFDDNLYKDFIDFHYNLDAKCKKSFYDISLERANELANSYDRIFVCISGGIDSTAILSSFYLTGNINKCVIVTKEDELENKDIILPWLKKNNIKTLFFDENKIGFADTILSFIDKNENYIITNGNCGDQIDHGVMINSDNRKKLGKNAKPDDLFKDCVGELVNEFLEQWLSKYYFGDQIKTILQLSWMFNFAVRWTEWEYQSIFMYHQLPPKVHKAFYATQEFTDFTLNRLEYFLHHNNPLDNKLYKPQSKVIIRKVFGDAFDDYGKVFSFIKVSPKNYIQELAKKHIVATDGLNLYDINFNKINKNS